MRLHFEEAVHGCGEANWDGYGADSVIPSSVEWADRLLQALGSSLPRPEIGVAPDGHIVIEWIGDRGRGPFVAHPSHPDGVGLARHTVGGDD